MKNYTTAELRDMSDRDFISAIWGEAVIQAIDMQDTTPMTMQDFLSHCTACGGNWGGMLLTGMRKLFPAVYDAIPDNMGMFAWNGICATLNLLGVVSDPT